MVRYLSELPNEDPIWSKNRKGNNSDDRGRGDKHWITHFPAEQHEQTCDGNQSRQPIADGYLAQQRRRSQDCSDCRRVRAFDEAPYIRLCTVANQDRRNDQDKQERWKEYSYRGNCRAPKSGDEIADERRGDDHRT